MSTTDKIESKAPTMILEPEKWALEMQELAAEYIGLPESPIFLNASRRFRALAEKLKLEIHDPKAPDGFVVGGDIR